MSLLLDPGTFVGKTLICYRKMSVRYLFPCLPALCIILRFIQALFLVISHSNTSWVVEHNCIWPLT